MNKIRCEVCGSAQIKKKEDSVFECRNCGVLYDKEEVRKQAEQVAGNARFDPSEEADHPQPSKQSESRAGARPSSENVSDARFECFAAQSAPGSFANVAVIRRNLDTQTATENAYRFLHAQEKVIFDLFANLEPVSRVEKYYPFSVLRSDVAGTFAGTACFRRDVPYTEFETRTEYRNGTSEEVTVPVTRYRTEVEKMPAHGRFSAAVFGAYSISAKLNESVSEDRRAGAESLRVKMLRDLEKKVLRIFRTRNHVIEKAEGARFEPAAGRPQDETDLDQPGEAWIEQAAQEHIGQIRAACQIESENRCAGDYCEDVSFNVSQLDSVPILLYVPVQILKFCYKGDTYTVVQILNSEVNEIAAFYPLSAEIDERSRR